MCLFSSTLVVSFAKSNFFRTGGNRNLGQSIIPLTTLFLTNTRSYFRFGLAIQKSTGRMWFRQQTSIEENRMAACRQQYNKAIYIYCKDTAQYRDSLLPWTPSNLAIKIKRNSKYSQSRWSKGNSLMRLFDKNHASFVL